MHGIDIASYQGGIDIANTEADFVIIKATEGTTYENPFWRDWAEDTLNAGKLLGFYHYADGGDIHAEADFFLSTVSDYIGRAILCLDWEEGGNCSYAAMGNWCNPWLDYVCEQTGATPLLYVSASIRDNFEGYPMWIAQYGYDDQHAGYTETPWNEGAYDCAIRQYSSEGGVNGYWGNIDKNKAYIDAEQWKEYAGCETKETETEREFEMKQYIITLNKDGNEHMFLVQRGSTIVDGQPKMGSIIHIQDPNDLAIINSEWGFLDTGEIPRIGERDENWLKNYYAEYFACDATFRSLIG